MKALTAVVIGAALLLGCTGSKGQKLPVCRGGQYRYANVSGTILPTLPIPGQPAADAPASPGAKGTPPGSSGGATPDSRPVGGSTFHPSC